jgi:hypothetical protein
MYVWPIAGTHNASLLQDLGFLERWCLLKLKSVQWTDFQDVVKRFAGVSFFSLSAQASSRTFQGTTGTVSANHCNIVGLSEPGFQGNSSRLTVAG